MSLRYGLCYLYYRKNVNGVEEDVVQSIIVFRDGKVIMTQQAFIIMILNYEVS